MPAPSHVEKAARFLAWHTAPGTFVLPNAWDAGSAKVIADVPTLKRRSPA